MTSANRVQVATVDESTLGTTPNTPRMRLARFTSGDPQFKPTFVDPDEIRSDRMLNDPIKVMSEADVQLGGELYFPIDGDPLSNFIRSAMYSTWVNTPSRDNDGTADSVITNVATSGTIVTVNTGAAFVAGQLVRFSGFTVAGNNGVFKCTTGSATAPAFVGSGITDEAAPPAAARMKVVGFIGAAGDISATSAGLASSSLDFTALGLAVGMWVKVGGTGSGDHFATAANNSWARIQVIAAHLITLDNKPTGWAAEVNTAATIKVFFGDYIKNGITKKGVSIEFGYLGQTVPTYVLCAGQIPNTMEWNISSRQKITTTLAFMGMSGTLSTTAQDASPDARSTAVVMAANANVSRMSEGGTKLVMPNCAREITYQINNNLRKIECVDDDAPVDINEGQFELTGRLNGYYGSDALYTKFLAGTPTSISSIIEKNNQAFIMEVPRATYRAGSPNVTGKNTDVMLPLDFAASIDSTYTNAAFIINRMEYVDI